MNLFIPKSSKQQGSYDTYQFTVKEYLWYGIQGIGILATISYVFYRSVWAFLLFLPGLYFFYQYKRKQLLKKQKEKISLEFREMMQTVITGLQAGYSIENAFIRSYQEMVMLYGDQSGITKELFYITKALRNNQNLETLLVDLANRTHNEDIQDFSEVFVIAKRSGGDMIGILKNTVNIISDKMEVKREILTLISAKQFEQSIMNVIPFLIILYVDMTSPGFFDGLYHNPVGVIIMTILLGVYLFAYLLAKKIIDIRV